MLLKANYAWLAGLLLWGTLGVSASEPDNDGDESDALEIIEVTGQRVANLQPASTFAATVTQLRFDPQIDIQARGLPESQADVTIRGGLFENTGFKIGAVTIFDPQTGHYSVELPIDPDMLTAPALMTDSENSIHAFNATVATVNYNYADIAPGGTARLGFGSDDLRFASARISFSKALSEGQKAGLTLSAAASSGDGTLPFGDHEFKRFAGHFQLGDEDRETNLIVGYQDKFFGWPGMHIPDSPHCRKPIMSNRAWSFWTIAGQTRAGWWQVAGAYRRLDDDYDFDRRTVDTGGPGSFEHETRSFSLGHQWRPVGQCEVNWTYAAMLAADRLVRSTDLTNGYFNSRTYLSMSLAPAWMWVLGSGAELEVRAGLRADISNRGRRRADARWQRHLVAGAGHRYPVIQPGPEQNLPVTRIHGAQLPAYRAFWWQSRSRP